MVRNVHLLYLEQKKQKMFITLLFILCRTKKMVVNKKGIYWIKKIYQTKYGTGNSIESFSTPYAEGDGNELDAIKDMKCTYLTEWKSNRGKILIMISYDGQIAIDYEDVTNELKSKNEKSNSHDGWKIFN